MMSPSRLWVNFVALRSRLKKLFLEIPHGSGGTVLQIEDNQDDPSDALQTTAGQITAVDPLGGYPVQPTGALVLEDPG
eukprot:COSAG05_NODE_2238_length_3355_cov_1.687039_2_plen_78_part_00